MQAGIPSTSASLATPLRMKVSETREERSAAFQLVHRVYRRAGLTADNQMQMRVIPHHLLDTTEVLIAQQAEQVTFTITLVRDGLEGLPSESLFAEQVAAMRSDGLSLAEVSCVASNCGDENKKERFETLVRMISLTIHTARQRGVDRLLLAVHPRHAKVYQRLFGCVPCSGVEQYEAVQGKPAVLCMHDFDELDRRRYPLYDHVYGHQYAPWQLAGAPMSLDEKEFFHQAISVHSDQLVPMAA
ncbi:N-acyl amino acid synthase FeeM domain-containing protein [Candidatus Laterigemmans baculatus]|uniref:N-acyl amino acid synthase FeeM domain-containing protein n=1 Tax=Candidatus Laterigemmans baculatus TaxID=2770505 RepID=UPI0013D9C970|nr:hypothetical protein [Candidatus Laterigemmans baculatus]